MEPHLNVWRQTEKVRSSLISTHTVPEDILSHSECRAEDCVPSPVKDTSGTTTVVVASVVCSLVFLSVGVLLGGVGLYLILRVRGRSSGPTPSPPPPVTYEEVGVARKVKRSQDFQLTSNEAYGPIQKDNIHTSPNTAYQQVHL